MAEPIKGGEITLVSAARKSIPSEKRPIEGSEEKIMGSLSHFGRGSG